MSSGQLKKDSLTKDIGRGYSQRQSDDKQVVLRLPPRLLDQIDRAVARRVIKVPRHTWLLEAIAEKLEKEIQMLERDHG